MQIWFIMQHLSVGRQVKLKETWQNHVHRIILVLVLGGRDFIIGNIYLVYKRYIVPIGWLYATYHHLQEPETSVDNLTTWQLDIDGPRIGASGARTRVQASNVQSSVLFAIVSMSYLDFVFRLHTFMYTHNIWYVIFLVNFSILAHIRVSSNIPRNMALHLQVAGSVIDSGQAPQPEVASYAPGLLLLAPHRLQHSETPGTKGCPTKGSKDSSVSQITISPIYPWK